MVMSSDILPVSLVYMFDTVLGIVLESLHYFYSDRAWSSRAYISIPDLVRPGFDFRFRR